MQIIGGRFRGLKLKSPLDFHTRPTLSRIREALFNILAPRLAESRFLDLYAGAGSIGLEAYSRGSSRVVFVEYDRMTVKILTDNLRRLDSAGQDLELVNLDALAAAQRLHKKQETFDIIFLDPPYEQSVIEAWGKTDTLKHLLNPQGIVIFQHGRRETVPDEWAGCGKSRERRYGETVLSFFEATSA